jgi:hypothetical protein
MFTPPGRGHTPLENPMGFTHSGFLIRSVLRLYACREEPSETLAMSIFHNASAWTRGLDAGALAHLGSQDDGVK